MSLTTHDAHRGDDCDDAADDDYDDNEEFLCPIQHEIMRDPVVASDGFSYERAAISEWMLRSNVSPMTRTLFSSKYKISNQQTHTHVAMLRLSNEREIEIESHTYHLVIMIRMILLNECSNLVPNRTLRSLIYRRYPALEGTLIRETQSFSTLFSRTLPHQDPTALQSITTPITFSNLRYECTAHERSTNTQPLRITDGSNWR